MQMVHGWEGLLPGDILDCKWESFVSSAGALCRTEQIISMAVVAVAFGHCKDWKNNKTVGSYNLKIDKCVPWD